MRECEVVVSSAERCYAEVVWCIEFSHYKVLSCRQHMEWMVFENLEVGQSMIIHLMGGK